MAANVDMIIDMTTELENPGEAVEVTIPDTSEYMEMDASLLG